jgi:hypothetical protein
VCCGWRTPVASRWIYIGIIITMHVPVKVKLNYPLDLFNGLEIGRARGGVKHLSEVLFVRDIVNVQDSCYL